MFSWVTGWLGRAEADKENIHGQNHFAVPDDDSSDAEDGGFGGLEMNLEPQVAECDAGNEEGDGQGEQQEEERNKEEIKVCRDNSVRKRKRVALGECHVNVNKRFKVGEKVGKSKPTVNPEAPLKPKTNFTKGTSDSKRRKLKPSKFKVSSTGSGKKRRKVNIPFVDQKREINTSPCGQKRKLYSRKDARPKKKPCLSRSRRYTRSSTFSSKKPRTKLKKSTLQKASLLRRRAARAEKFDEIFRSLDDWEAEEQPEEKISQRECQQSQADVQEQEQEQEWDNKAQHAEDAHPQEEPNTSGESSIPRRSSPPANVTPVAQKEKTTPTKKKRNRRTRKSVRIAKKTKPMASPAMRSAKNTYHMKLRQSARLHKKQQARMKEFKDQRKRELDEKELRSEISDRIGPRLRRECAYLTPRELINKFHPHNRLKTNPTLDQLRRTMKRVVVKYHPDR
ncbi:hypothetical protein AAMO2058_001701200 [Amorphochlora amoebiformis]